MNFEIDPNLRQSLTLEQQTQLEQIERLGELDPDVTARLARLLDRLQATRPYLGAGSSASADKLSSGAARPALSEAEQAARDAFISQELSALLAVAGRLNQAFGPPAQADRRFRDSLRAEFK